MSKVEVKKKPENEQANFLDMFSNQNKQEEIEKVEDDTIEEKKLPNPLTREQMELLVKTFDEPELEEELRQLKEKEEKQTLKIENIDMETGEVLTSQTIGNELIEILNKLLDNKLKVSI